MALYYLVAPVLETMYVACWGPIVHIALHQHSCNSCIPAVAALATNDFVRARLILALGS